MNGKELGLVLNEAQAKNVAAHHYAQECARQARTSKSALEDSLAEDEVISAEVKELYASIPEIGKLREQLDEIKQWAAERAKHSGSLDVQGALHRANTTQNKTLQKWNIASYIIKDIRAKLSGSDVVAKYNLKLPETLNIIRDNAAFAVDIATFIEGSISNRQKRLDEYEIPGTFSKLYGVCRFHGGVTSVTEFSQQVLKWVQGRFIDDLQRGGEEFIQKLKDREYQLNYLNKYIEDMSDYVMGRAISVIGDGITQAINQNVGDVFTFSRECSDKIPRQLADPAGNANQSAIAKALKGTKDLRGLPEIFEATFGIPCILS